MTDYKTLDLIGSSVFAALFLWLTYDHGGADTWPGILFLAGWCYHLTRAGLAAEVLTRRWAIRHKVRSRRKIEAIVAKEWSDEEREERAASAARHPSNRHRAQELQDSVTATVQKHRHRVHNHGPAEGRGLDCPEYGRRDGSLVGKCIIDAARRESLEGLDR